MISITCTQCRTVLTIDDAFAGGVCRCQHCGTIQTVPKNSANTASYVNPSATASKALYQNQSASRTGGTGGGNVATTGSQSPSGLDDLAQAVVSSGLSGSGLRSSGDAPSTTPLPKTPQAQLVKPEASAGAVQKKKPPVIPIAIAGGVVVVGIVVWLVIHALSGGTGGSSGGGGTTTSKGSFSGVPLSGSTVVYVIDRGNSLAHDFDAVKAATYESISTLGADGKFAVILWNNGGSDVAFPNDGVRNATSDQKQLLSEQLDKVQATGASRLRGGLERALARSPNSIVMITGKPGRLDEDDENALSEAKEKYAG